MQTFKLLNLKRWFIIKEIPNFLSQLLEKVVNFG